LKHYGPAGSDLLARRKAGMYKWQSGSQAVRQSGSQAVTGSHRQSASQPVSESGKSGSQAVRQ